MAGTLTRILLTVLPTRTVLATQRKLRAKIFEFKNPKAIQVMNPRRDCFDYTYHVHWCNPNFPKLGFAQKADSRGGEFLKRHYDVLDKLPEEFFTNRGIEDHRVPFDYWFPMWKENFKRRAKSSIWTVSAVFAACILPLLIIILNNMR